jgi:hypothetical protein
MMLTGTNLSEEHIGYMFVVGELNISSTLKMEALSFSETAVPL